MYCVPARRRAGTPRLAASILHRLCTVVEGRGAPRGIPILSKHVLLLLHSVFEFNSSLLTVTHLLHTDGLHFSDPLSSCSLCPYAPTDHGACPVRGEGLGTSEQGKDFSMNFRGRSCPRLRLPTVRVVLVRRVRVWRRSGIRQDVVAKWRGRCRRRI